MNSTPFYKRTGFIVLGVIVALAIILGISLVGAYNGFITKNTAADTQWAQVETQYQRRFDLIPNLVRAAEAVMEQEKEVFTALADARARYSGAGTPDEKAQAATQVEGALSRLLVVVENYPQLNSSQNVLNVQAELAGTENRISVERGRYNETVQDYNLAVKRLPGALIAGLFGFDERSFFEAAEGTDVAPQAF